MRESLEGLEAHLAQEDGELARQRDELAEAWAAFHAAVETRRRSDQALQAEREEALRFAEEVREGAMRDAEELLQPLKAERRAAAEDLAAARAEREAVEHSLAVKHHGLVELEAKILADSETVRTALEGVRASLDARGRSLGEREEDVRRRDEQLALREQELSGQRAALEAREESLAAALVRYEREVATHKGHVERFNERFAEQKAEAEKEFQAREKEFQARTAPPSPVTMPTNSPSRRPASRRGLARAAPGSTSSRI